MEKLNKIIVGEWSTKSFRYNKASSCTLSVTNINNKNVIYEAALNTDKYLNVVIEGSTLIVIPFKQAKADNSVTIYAKVNNKVIAKEIIPIQIGKHKKRALALWLCIGIGLGLPVVASVIAGTLLALKPSENEDKPVVIGNYIFSSSVNCKVSTDASGNLVIDVIDPTKPASVDVKYDGDPEATFDATGQSGVAFKGNTLEIPANTVTEQTPVNIIISSDQHPDEKIDTKIETEEKPGPTPVKTINLSNPQPVADTGVEINNKTITYTKGDAIAGQFTLDLSDTLETSGSWVIKVNGFEETGESRIVASLKEDKILTVSIPKTHDDISSKTISIENTTSSPKVNKWEGTITIQTPTPHLTLSTPTAVEGTGVVVDGNNITYTRIGATDAGQFTLDLSGTLSTQGTWVVQVNGSVESGTNAITASLNKQLLTVTIPKGHADELTAVSLKIANPNSTPIVDEWEGTIVITNIIKLNNPTKLTDNIEISEPTRLTSQAAITYTKDGQPGKFKLTADEPIIAKDGVQLTWTVIIQKTPTNLISVELDPKDNTTLTVTIDPEITTVLPTVNWLINCEGATKPVAKWIGELTLVEPTPSTITLKNLKSASDNVIVDASKNEIVWLRNQKNGSFTLEADNEIIPEEGKELEWTIIRDGTKPRRPEFIVELGDDNKTLTITTNNWLSATEDFKTLCITCANSTVPVNQWDGWIAQRAVSTSINLTNPTPVTENVTIDDNAITYTNDEIDGQFTLTADGDIIAEDLKELVWTFTLNGREVYGITPSLDSDMRTVTFTISSDIGTPGDPEPLTIDCANATKTVNTWTGSLQIKEDIGTTIDLINPTEHKGNIEIGETIKPFSGPNIIFTPNGESGIFTLTATEEIIADPEGSGLEWTVVIGKRTVKTVSVNLGKGNTTVYVEIDADIEPYTVPQAFNISCTGATKTVNTWEGSIEIKESEPVKIYEPSVVSGFLQVSGADDNVITYTPAGGAGRIHLHLTEEVTDGDWYITVGGETIEYAKVSRASKTRLMVVLNPNISITKGTEIKVYCENSTKTVVPWTGTLVVREGYTLNQPKAVEDTGVEVPEGTKNVIYTKDTSEAGQFTLTLSNSLNTEGNWIILLGDSIEEGKNAITAQLDSEDKTKLIVTIPKTHGNVINKEIQISNIGSAMPVVPWNGTLTIKDKQIEGAVNLDNLANGQNGVTLDSENNIITYTKSDSGGKDGTFTLDMSNTLDTQGTWTITVNGVKEEGPYAITANASNTTLTVTIPTGHNLVSNQTITISNDTSSPAVNSWNGTLVIQDAIPIEGEVNFFDPQSVTTDSVTISGTGSSPIVIYEKNENDGQFSLFISEPLTEEGKWIILINGVVDESITASLTRENKLTITIPNNYSATTPQKITIINTTASPTINPWNGILIVV